MRSALLLIAVTAAAQSPAQQTIDAVRVVARTVERKIELPGEFQPWQQTAVHAKIAGFVDRVLVDRGSQVNEGELLAQLTAPELESQVAEARARVRGMESQVAEAEARLVAAQSTYEKLRGASQTPGAVAANELVQAQKLVDAEKARLEAARSSVDSARANLEAVEDMRAYLRVTAPFSGVVTTRYVHPGALAGAQTGPLFDIEQRTRLRLVVAVPERDAGGIPRGGRVNFTVPAYPGVTFSGTVARISGAVDPKTRTMPVEVDVQNPRDRLAPGMYPTVAWPEHSARPVLLAPASAVAVTTERSFVNRLRNGTIEWVDVVKGTASGDLVEITGGLNAGDVVALRGTDELRPGTRVHANVK